jgi:hypothetical protein
MSASPRVAPLFRQIAVESENQCRPARVSSRRSSLGSRTRIPLRGRAPRGTQAITAKFSLARALQTGQPDLAHRHRMSQRSPSVTLSTLIASVTAVGQAARVACRVLAYRESVPLGSSGAFVALVGENLAFQVGLLSDPLGWQSLDGLVHDDTPELAGAHVAARFVTLAARALKASVPEARGLALGLPLVVDGGVLVGKDTAVQAADIVLGQTRALLVLLERRRS